MYRSVVCTRRVAKKKLDLFEFASGLMAEAPSNTRR
jgi:hypothetical protein